ncbi:MAG TPA: TonB-dependent receptor [Nitrospiraceae bacterium]|nr:TonB-dependent receptor [Nitrospiraceae bacterium]
MMRYLFLIFMHALLSVNILFAETAVKPEQLEEVVVTATRTDRATEEIPAGVSAVTKEDISNTRMFGIKEALTGLSGVQAESRNGGYDARLIIRGAGLKARYGVREIMILLDGVPVTDPDGLSRLDFVDTQLVERIDIVKGPNSTLYGANAAGGVINIITKSPYEEVKSIKLGYGSEDTQMYNLLYGNHIGSTYFTVSGSRRSTDSWREWNEFETTQGNFKLGHMFSDKTSVEATVNYTKADIQLPGSLTEAQFEDDITQLTSDIWRHSGRYSEVFFSNLKMETELDRVKLKPVVYFSKWDHYHPVTGLINEGGASVYGTDIQADITHKIAGMDGTLTTGFTGQIDKADGDKYTYQEYVTGTGGRILYTLSDEKGELAEEGNDTTTKWGVFIQESISPSDKWIIDMGVRYDEVGFDINTDKYKEYNYSTGKYIAKSETIDEVQTFDNISPRLGVVYKLTEIFNLYGNASTGFQTPQSSELSINPDLKPSTTYNYETGIKGRFEGGHSLDLSVFYMTVKDEIVQTTEPGNISSYSNAGESIKKGAELSGKLQALKGLFLGGAYTYSNFKFVDFTEPIKGVNYDRGGNRFPYIPKHQYTLYALYKHPRGFKVKVDTNAWGSYYIDNANTEKYEGYKFITNALVGYEDSRLDVTFDVLNVFDKKYAMEVTKESGGAAKYRPAAPQTWMAKAGYKF